MNFQDASNLQIPEGYVRTIHDKDSRLLWGSVGYDVSFDGDAVQGPLPSQYRQVEYIEATGTQYVNTGVSIASAGAQWSATIDIQYTATASPSQIMLGTGTSAGGWSGQNGGFYALGATNRTTYASTQRVQAYVTFGTSASITIESETVTRAGSVPGGSVYLLAAANGDFACEAKLYSCKIYNASNVLIRDFVPCVRKSDSVAGLYDMVNMAFYVSNGADAFIAGGNVPSPDSPQEIQTVTGEQTVKVTGKNLMPILDGTTTLNGITATVADGILTLNGTSTASGYIKLTNGLVGRSGASIDSAWLNENVTNDINGKVISFDCLSGTAPTNSWAFRRFSTSASHDQQWLAIVSDTSTAFTSSASISCLAVFINAGMTFDNYKVAIQLELGSTATTYEPYQGQSYEVNLGGNVLDIGTSFDDYFALDANGTRVKNASITSKATGTIQDGKITVSTYDNSDGYWWASKEVMLEKNTNYTFSTADGTHARLNIVGIADFEIGTVGTVLLDYRPTDTAPATFNTGNYNHYVFTFYPATSSTNNNGVIDRPMLQKGTTATGYCPYVPYQIELAKIGTYQDRIYKDSGKWYIEKQVGKVVLDGTAGTFGSNQFGSNYRCYLVKGSIPTLATPYYDGATTPAPLSDIMIGAYQGTIANPTGATGCLFFPHSGVDFYFTVPDTIATSGATFKTWLTTHPMTIHYALATPTTTEITDATLIAQLEAVYDWVRRHGYNASVTGDLPIVISRTALPTV